MLFDDINEVTLMGNITADPDLRFTPGGTAVMNFGMATNRRYKQGEEWTDEVTYHNVVVWGNMAQSLSTRIKKGTKVHVSGRLQVRTWDGNDGKKNYKTEVVAGNVILIDRYNKDVDGSQSEAPAQKRGKSKDSEPEFEPEASTDSIDPDELPF